MRQEAGEGLLLDRLDLFAQAGEGFAADDAQDFLVAPFAMEAAGAEAALDDTVFRGQVVKGLLDFGGVEGEAVADFFEGEGAVGAGVSADELDDWVSYGFKERGGNAGRERDAEAVAVTGAVFNGDDALFSGDADFQETAGADETVNEFKDFRAHNAESQFFAAEIAKAEKQVVQSIG